jgi:hypothetical protein
MQVVELIMVGFPLKYPDTLVGQNRERPKGSHPQSIVRPKERSLKGSFYDDYQSIIITAMALLLAGYAFWDGTLSGGHILNPFGIMFLFLSGAVWLGWKPIREIFRSTRDESVIPTIVKGMGKRAPSRR